MSEKDDVAQTSVLDYSKKALPVWIATRTL